MSLTVQQLLSDAKRLTGRLRDHDSAADGIISAAQDVLKEVEAMRQYQEDIDSLNAVAHNRPRAQLVLGIQQENRHIRQLQHENKELRAALEEHQNVLELIMSKYRQHMSCLVNSTKIEKDTLIQENSKLLQDRADKICEMANVMQKSIQIDEKNIAKEQEMLARLITENRGLREMLEISHRNGSYSNPCVGPRMVSTGCQTEEDEPEKAEDDNAFKPKPSAAGSLHPNVGQGDDLVSNSSSTSPAGGAEPSPPPPVALSSSSFVNMNGAIQEDAISPQRPLSSASEESESSISEDDEISFNTIKRQVKPRSPNPGLICDEETFDNSVTSAVKNNLVNSSIVNSEGDIQVNGLTTSCSSEDNNNGHSHHIEDKEDHPPPSIDALVNNGGQESSEQPDLIRTTSESCKKLGNNANSAPNPDSASTGTTTSSNNEAIIEQTSA